MPLSNVAVVSLPAIIMTLAFSMISSVDMPFVVVSKDVGGEVHPVRISAGKSLPHECSRSAAGASFDFCWIALGIKGMRGF